MDQIRITGLEVYAHHGVYPEETRLGQKFRVDAVLRLSTREAGQEDDLTKSVNYGEVSHFITKFLTEHTYRLIEAAIEELAHALLLEYELVRGVTLTLHKPEAPIGLPIADVAVCIDRGWHKAYLALGSNLGDRRGYIEQGIRELEALPECRVIQVSELIETEPYGMAEQERFLNGCLELDTLLSPEELLECLHEIEAHANRTREIHWGPRTLDLDILLYDEAVQAGKKLTIPHRDMQNRMFVLEPLSRIAPYAQHPVLHRCILELREALKLQEVKETV